MTDSLQVGQKVELNDDRVAYIRFIGETTFARGEWIGVELEEATGKNDGSVLGTRYFDCDDGYGMFLKRTGVAGILEDATPKPQRTERPQSHVERARRSFAPGNVTRAREGTDVSSRRQNANNESPTPGARRQSGIVPPRSPTKSPLKQSTSARPPSVAVSQTSSPSTVRKRVSGIAPRPNVNIHGRKSLAPPVSGPGVSRGPRQSLAKPIAGLNRTPTLAGPTTSRSPASQLALPAQQGDPTRVGSFSSTSQASETSAQESAVSEDAENGPSRSTSRSPLLEDKSEVSSEAGPPQTSVRTRDERSTSIASSQGPRTGSISLAQSLSRRNAAGREVEDLQTKLRVMERRRLEDREKLSAMDKLKQERDRFQTVIQKLEAKVQTQHQDIVNLKKTLKELEASLRNAEAVQAEHDSVLENAALDREMAEETAEALKTELDALKQRSEELELEVEVLRQENDELGQEMSPAERTSQGWLQMERSNERLREALLRLRDMTQQQEADLKEQIKTLEQDIQNLSGYKQQYEYAKASLLESEAAIEDLRQQLDVALGAEDMIEELTEKNLALNEAMSELRGAVDELENLKELNDELEINHVENEKQMQEEIDYKDSVVAEQNRRLAQQNEALEDCELTIARFRELVRNMQNDLQDMRASQQLTETEAGELTSRSRAMMDLNLKLQASAAKTQVKAIDLELRRLEAQEAAEHLAIVQLYLPEAFSADRDSVLTLLRFKRIAFKARLLHGSVKERASEEYRLASEEDIFTAFKVLDQLTWLAAMCDRFINYMNGCSIETFEGFGSAVYELEPVERALNRYIDGWKSQELKEAQMAEELQRSVNLMNHLADTHMQQTIESYAEDVLMRTLLMQSHLENTAAAFALIQRLLISKLPQETDEDMERGEYFARTSETLISRTRYAKVAVGKTLRSVEELKARSLSLNTSTSDSFDSCLDASAQMATYAREVGSSVTAMLHEEGRDDPLSWNEVQSAMKRTAESTFNAPDESLFSTFNTNLQSLIQHLEELNLITSNLSMTTEFERLPPPWHLRSKALISSPSISADAAREIERLKAEMAERISQSRTREQMLEEASVKIELLEARMGDATRKSANLAAMERKVEEKERREKEALQAMEVQLHEFRNVEMERERWKRVAEENAVAGRTAAVGGGEREGADGGAEVMGNEKERLKREIESLRAAIKFLREDNKTLRFPNTHGSKSMAWLSEPLIRKKTDAQVRQEILAKERKDAMDALLDLVSTAKVVSLRDLPDDKLAWRPAKMRPRKRWLEQVRGFEAWVRWMEDVERRGRGRGSWGRREKRRRRAREGAGKESLRRDWDSGTRGGWSKKDGMEAGAGGDVVVIEQEG